MGKSKGLIYLYPVADDCNHNDLLIAKCIKTKRLNKEVDNLLKKLIPLIYCQSKKNIREIIDRYFECGIINGLEKKMVESKIIMNQICSEIETEIRDICGKEFIATVYIYDEENKHLYLGASPNGIPGWNEALESLEITPGPNVGSCGTALYYGTPVVVSDTYTDDKWEIFRDLVTKFEIRSDWSVPFYYEGKPVGTFVMVSREIQHPTKEALQLVINKARELEEKLAEIQNDLYRIRHRIFKIEGIVDLDGKIEMVKSELPQYLEGVNRKDFIHPADSLEVSKLWERVKCGEKINHVYRVKKQYIEKDSEEEWIPVEVTWTPIIDDDGEVIACQSVVLLDSPKCREYEKTKLHLKKFFKFHAVTDSSGFAITQVGEGIRNVLGIEPTAWMGIKKYVNIHPADVNQAYGALYRSRDEKKITSSVHRFIGKDGSVVTLELHFNPILDDNGNVTNIYVEIYQDTPRCQKFEMLAKKNIKCQ
nr:PAS domain-containing protein [Neobacillus sp. Marseille-Q6967]